MKTLALILDCLRTLEALCPYMVWPMPHIGYDSLDGQPTVTNIDTVNVCIPFVFKAQ